MRVQARHTLIGLSLLVGALAPSQLSTGCTKPKIVEPPDFPITVPPEHDVAPFSDVVLVRRNGSLRFPQEDRLYISRTGKMHHVWLRQTDAGVTASPSERQISAAELAALEELLEDEDVCDLRADGETNYGDYYFSILEVSWGEQQCRVVLWEHDWEQQGDAEKIHRALRRLSRGESVTLPDRAAERLARLPADVLLRWGTSHAFWGAASLQIRTSGDASYQFTPSELVPDGGAAKQAGPWRLSAQQLEQLREVLSDHDACDLESERDGIPDEGGGVLTVSWGDLRCSIRLWAGEWDDDDDARAIRDALNAIQERVSGD